ncbi:MAG: hypothetical protein Ct9H300mP14_06630 [Gammaproteobacteria bacterium]|nr:MAG: hypothetical protein Ct9H300mP14_06630 [Gammaproteobacteria bacterium]
MIKPICFMVGYSVVWGNLVLIAMRDYFQMLAADQEGQERQRFFQRDHHNQDGLSTAKKEHFDLLVREIYPELREKSFPGLSLPKSGCGARVCSFGQEAYSLALDASEFFAKELSTGMDLKILATDVNTEALTVAQRGQYAVENSEYSARRFFGIVTSDVSIQINKICARSVNQLRA